MSTNSDVEVDLVATFFKLLDLAVPDTLPETPAERAQKMFSTLKNPPASSAPLTKEMRTKAYALILETRGYWNEQESEDPSKRTVQEHFLPRLATRSDSIEKELALVEEWLAVEWPNCCHCDALPAPGVGAKNPFFICFNCGYGVCQHCHALGKHPASHVLAWMNPFLERQFQDLPQTEWWNKLYECKSLPDNMPCAHCTSPKIGSGSFHSPTLDADGSPSFDEDHFICSETCLNEFDEKATQNKENRSYFPIRAPAEKVLPKEEIERYPRKYYSEEKDACELVKCDSCGKEFCGPVFFSSSDPELHCKACADRLLCECDSCGEKIYGPVFYSISVPEYAICNACASGRTDDEWRTETHVGFLCLDRQRALTGFIPKKRTVDKEEVSTTDNNAEDDRQRWTELKFSGYYGLEVERCSGMKAAFIKSHDVDNRLFDIHAAICDDGNPEGGFSREKQDAVAAAVARLKGLPVFRRHDNLLEMCSYGAKDGQYTATGTLRFCSFSPVPAGSLESSLIDKGWQCSEKQVQGWVRQMLEGLQHMHSQGVVHGNIQSGTCLIEKEKSNVTLSPPLLMWQLLYGVVGDDENSERYKEVLRMCNKATVHFLAPEVAAGEPRSTKSDIYAVGAVMAHLINSRKLCELWKGTPEELVEFIASHPSYPQPRWLQTKEPFCRTGGGVHVCRKMLAVLPKDRPTISEILEDEYFKKDFSENITAPDLSKSPSQTLEEARRRGQKV